MKHSRFIALSDIYGHITSIVLISLLGTIPYTTPYSSKDVNREALIDSVNYQWSTIFQAFNPDCNFMVLTYYNAYGPSDWAQRSNQSSLLEYDYWRKFDITRLFPELQKELFSPSLFFQINSRNNSQLLKKTSSLSITKNEYSVQNQSKIRAWKNQGLYIPVFPEPIVYKNSSGQQTTILPVDINQFRVVEGLNKYEPKEWIQDYFTILQDADNNPVLLEPINYATTGDRIANYSIADHLAFMSDFVLKPSAYRFIGGNILVIDTSCAFIKIEHNLPGAEETFRQLLGVHKIGWLGIVDHPYGLYPPSPIESDSCSIYNDRKKHIDMYVTPAGKDSTGKDLILVGRVEDYCLLTNIENPNDIEAHNRMNCINEYLDTLQVQIERRSPEFVVKRLPLVLEEQPNGGFVLRTYNNCITEIYVDTLSHRTIKRIYLPDYTSTLPADNRFITIQNKVAERLTAYGFNDIRWVRKDFRQATDREGSFHCLVKVLSRTPYMR